MRGLVRTALGKFGSYRPQWNAFHITEANGLVKESASVDGGDPDAGFTHGGSSRNGQPQFVYHASLSLSPARLDAFNAILKLRRQMIAGFEQTGGRRSRGGHEDNQHGTLMRRR